jgi:hypothetical protein
VKKKIKGVILVLLVFIVTPVLLLMFIWKDRCQHTVIKTIGSESGSLQVVLQETDCGLAMSKATQVFLEEREANKWKSIGDVVVLQGVHAVSLQWQENSELVVGIPEGAVVVKSRDQVGDTRVSYIPVK